MQKKMNSHDTKATHSKVKNIKLISSIIALLAFVIAVGVPLVSYAHNASLPKGGEVFAAVSNDDFSVETTTTDANGNYYRNEKVHFKTVITNKKAEGKLENVKAEITFNTEDANLLYVKEGDAFIEAPKLNSEDATAKAQVSGEPTEKKITFTIGDIEQGQDATLEFTAQLPEEVKTPDEPIKTTVAVTATGTEAALNSECSITPKEFRAAWRIPDDIPLQLGEMYSQSYVLETSADCENVTVTYSPEIPDHSIFTFRGGSEDYDVYEKGKQMSMSIAPSSGVYDFVSGTSSYYENAEEFWDYLTQKAQSADYDETRDAALTQIASDLGLGSKDDPNFETANTYGPIFFNEYRLGGETYDNYYPLATLEIGDHKFSFAGEAKFSELPLGIQYFTLGNGGADVDFIDGVKKTDDNSSSITEAAQKVTDAFNDETGITITSTLNYSETDYKTLLEDGVAEIIAQPDATIGNIKIFKETIAPVIVYAVIPTMKAGTPITLGASLQYTAFGDDKIKLSATGKVTGEDDETLFKDFKTEELAHTATEPGADITVTVTSTPSEGRDYYKPGETINYEIFMVNSGTKDIVFEDGSVMTDNLETAEVKLADAGGVVDSRLKCSTYDAESASINYAEGVTIQREHTVTLDDLQKGTIQIEVTAKNFKYDGDSAATQTATGKSGDIKIASSGTLSELTLTKTAKSNIAKKGDDVEYTVVLTNPTPDTTAENVTLEDTVDSSKLELVGKESIENALTITPNKYTDEGDHKVTVNESEGGGAWKVTIPKLDYNEPITITYKMKVQEGVSLNEKITNTVESECASISNSTAKYDVTVSENDPDISILKRQAKVVDDVAEAPTKDPLEVRENDRVRYYIDVKNNGNGSAHDVVVTDTLPDGFTLDKESMSAAATNDGSDTWYEQSGQTITWHVKTIGPSSPAEGTEVSHPYAGSAMASGVYSSSQAKVNYYKSVQAFFEYAQSQHGSDTAFIQGIVDNFGLGSKESPDYSKANAWGPVFAVDFGSVSGQDDNYPLITLIIGETKYSLSAKKVSEFGETKIGYFTLGDSGSQIDFVNDHAKTEDDLHDIRTDFAKVTERETDSTIAVEIRYDAEDWETKEADGIADELAAPATDTPEPISIPNKYTGAKAKVGYYANVQSFFEFAKEKYQADSDFVDGIVTNFGLGQKENPSYDVANTWGPVFVVDFTDVSENAEEYPLITLDFNGKKFSIKSSKKISELGTTKVGYFTIGDGGYQVDFVDDHAKSAGDATDLNLFLEELVTEGEDPEVGVEIRYDETSWDEKIESGIADDLVQDPDEILHPLVISGKVHPGIARITFDVIVPDAKYDPDNPTTTWTNKAQTTYMKFAGAATADSNEVNLTQGAPSVKINLTQKSGEQGPTEDEITIGGRGFHLVTYDITVTNEGSEDAENVIVSSIYPQNGAVLQQSPPIEGSPKITEETHMIQWEVGTLQAAGDRSDSTRTFSFTMSLPDIDEESEYLEGDEYAYWRCQGIVRYDNDPERQLQEDGSLTDHSVASNETSARQGYPQLVITKLQKGPNGEEYSADELSLPPSRQVDYEITVRNDGTEDAEGVTLKDILTDSEPASAPLVVDETSLEEDSGEYQEDANTITWELGDIASGLGAEPKTVHFSATAGQVSEDTTWTNKAQAEYTSAPKEGEEGYVYSEPVVLHDERGVIEVEQYQQSGSDEKTQDPLYLKGGEELTYTYEVKNTTDVDIANATITVEVPEGLTIESRDSITPNSSVPPVTLNWDMGQNVSWTIANLEGQATQELSFKAKVPEITEAMTFTVKADIAYAGKPDSAPSESNTVVAYLTYSDLVVSKTATLLDDGEPVRDSLEVTENDKIKYTITVSNEAGTEDAENVVVTDEVPVGLSLNPQSINEDGSGIETITWNIPTIAKGESKELTFNVTVPHVSEHTDWANTANITYENNPDGAESVITTNTVHLIENAPSLTIKKSQTKSPDDPYVEKQIGLYGNEDIFYKIVVSNETGTEDASSLVVVDEVPVGISISQSDVQNGGQVDGQTITWNIDSLAVGDTEELTFKGHIGEVAAEQAFTNVATVDFEGNGDPIESNEVIASAAAPVLTLVAQHGTSDDDLTQDTMYRIENGNSIQYDITVSNTGTSAAEDFTVVATLTGNLEVNSGTISEPGPGTYDARNKTVTWNVSSLAAEQELHLSFTATATVEGATDEFTCKAQASYDDKNAESNLLTETADLEPGGKNPAALQASIEQAQQTIRDTVESRNGSGLQPGTKYATPGMIETLNAAIADAQEVLDDPASTQLDYNEAMTKLNGAVNDFVNGLITVPTPKVDPRLSVAIPPSLTGTTAKSYTVTYNGDGTVSAKSSSTSILAVSYNANTKKLTLTPKRSGTVTVTLSATGTDRYNAATKKYTIKVTVKSTNTNTNKNTNKNTNTNKNKNTSTNQRMPFTDVKSNAWYYDAVKWAYSNKLLTGYSGTTLFGPNDNLTRGQAAVILWRWFEPEQANKYVDSRGVNQTPFADNLNGKYYTGAMNWAYKQGIFTGYEGTNLVGVYDSLTRQQMCTVMYRCATKLSHTTSSYSSAKFNSFPDKSGVASYARTGMAWCVDKGVISGWDNKFLAPTMTIDRAQMSQIMMNAVTKNVLK